MKQINSFPLQLTARKLGQKQRVGRGKLKDTGIQALYLYKVNN